MGIKVQWNAPVKEDEVAMAGTFWTPSELDWALIPKVVEDAQMQVFSLGATENHQGEKVEVVSFSKKGIIVTMSNSKLEGKWLQYQTDEKRYFCGCSDSGSRGALGVLFTIVM